MARAKSKSAAASEPIDGPWALPDAWRWERLDAVAPVNPRRPLDELVDGDEIAFVGMASVGAGTGHIDVGNTRQVGHVRQGFTRFAPGDVLFAKITPCMENGKIAVVPNLQNGVGVGSTEFHVLAASEVSPRYLYYWVSQRSFRKAAEFNMTGTAGQKRVPPDFLRHSVIPVPSADTQRRIVTRIEELFAEVGDGEAALERARGDLATWRKALLKAAVTGELTADWRAANPPTETGADLLARILAERRTRWLADPRNKGKRYVEPAGPDTSDLPDLPEGWTWASVAQLGEVTGGVTKNTKRDIHLIRLPYLRVGNVYEGRLDLERIESIGLTKSELPRVALKEGDLLVVEGNGSIDQIGRCAVWSGAIEPCVHQNHLIKVRPAIRIFSDLIHAWLRSLAGRKELEERASSTSGLHTLSISKIEALRCPLPPVREIPEMLDRLGIALASCAEAMTAQEEVGAVSITLRQSILAAAFRGDLVA